MNRIYKVVWSKTKNCYTVVSEIAKRHGKRNRARTCATALLAALALTGFMGMSEAQAADVNATRVNASVVNTNTLNAKYNLSVGEMAGNGLMPFFVNSNGAFYAANNNFSVDKDGNVKAASGEIGGVTINKGIHLPHTSLSDGYLYVGDDKGHFSQISPESAKLGKVTINKEGNITGANAIQTNALNAKYNLSVGTANENGTVPFFVNSNGAFYAANGKLVVDKDGKVTATAGEIGGVTIDKGIYYKNTSLRDGSLYVGDDQGHFSQISPESAKLGKVTINKEGNITGANAIQTNALNAKYNLSVGTANENGTVPFFVNSNGAFYAANGKLVVDKDGKVTATAGEIGGVTIDKGIYYKNTSLRDGSLYVGDDQGHFSQISPESAKLGKVTINKEGNITGANAIQTNALNAKYNLSVGTANENGTVPFFVNSNGAFYAANGKLVVDKDGKVTATAGEIGNVVLNNGVYTGRSKLLDGELLVGDASGNYSQITTKGAKLGKVTIDEKGKITGVAAGAITADSTDAVNGSQLHAVATEAGKHSKVVNGSNINVEEAELNGQKIYKVGLNDDVLLGKPTGNNVSISGTKGTIETTGYIATKDRIIADKGAQLAGINVSGNIISNGAARIALYGDSGVAGMMNGKGASIYMQDGNTVINSKVAIDENGKITGVAAGAITADSTDAVNGSQLHAVATEAGKHSKVVNGSNINVEEAELNGQKIYKVGLNDDVLLGKPTGNNVSISGTKGTIETTGYIATKDRIIADKGAQLAGINVSGNIISNGAARIALYGDSGVAGMMNGKGASIYMQDGNTVINSKVAIDENGKITGVAAGKADTDAVNVGQLKTAVADAVKDAAKASDVGNIGDIHKELQNKDGSKTTVVDAVNNLDNKVGDLKYSAVTKGDIKDGDSSTTAIGKLNQKLSGVAAVAGQHSSVSTTDANIKIQEGTNAAGGKDYQLSLNPDQKLHSVTTGETKMDTKGLSIGDKTYVSKDGLNANNQTITNVKDGKIEKDSKDAVNGGQLYATNQLVKDNASNISLLGNSIDKLDNRVNKVGAGAAALAALHPLDFDPEDKWDFAAGYGNYSGASAVALGAYYRPNEDTMFSVGGSFGNGENMVNAGVSLKLGQSNRAPASKAAMEKKISALSQEVEELKAAIADLRAAQTKAKDATEKDAQKK